MLIEYQNKSFKTKIEPYNEYTYIVSRVPTDKYEYILLIAELPSNQNEEWLFEVEYGFKNGSAETEEWIISDLQKEHIKVEILDYIIKNKKGKNERK